MRQSLDRVDERPEAPFAAYMVQVVDDDDDAPFVAGEAVQQFIDRGLDARAWRPEAYQRGARHSVPHPIDGMSDIRPQPHRVVVARVERDPRR